MQDIRELLQYIDPAELDYQEWVNVGMALKQEGYTAADWDAWSQADHRYKHGECFKKWTSFHGASVPVAAGTIVEYAKRGGYVFGGGTGRALDWDSIIVKDDLSVIDAGWLEDREVQEPSDAVWNPVQDLITYLQTLFQSTENVGYVTAVYDDHEGHFKPQKGLYDRTAGELIEELRKCNGDMGRVIGDCKPEAGAWIRFNPLDGNGVKNDNVTDYRYALVESDKVDIARQNAILRELELPIACMVFSGGKSVHAIVKIEAGDYAEYRKRVEYLYKVCEKNGLKVDTQNKNPSRLSRMPGVTRNGRKQFLMATNIGKSSWTEWEEWIEGINDNLPDPESLDGIWGDIPPLADCLIEGVLRKGHKLLLSGPSKAGKSFILIELVIAIAEGRKWLNFQCSKGRVLYVNLELDRASCLHRFRDVYQALGWRPESIQNIDIWNLRGKAVPLDALAPKLIRRAEKKDYTAIIIDPIYKIITGDENSADQMAKFCNQFDKICTELKAATIYCHHHSKGSQAGKKSMDRASGSGVFARDPDALLDLVELELSENVKKHEAGKARIRGIEKALNRFFPGWENDLGPDERLSPSQMHDYASGRLNFDQADIMQHLIADEQEKTSARTAWRMEATLREFAPFKPISFWFNYPVHAIDDTGALSDLKVDDPQPRRTKERRSAAQNEKKESGLSAFIMSFDELEEDGEVDIKTLSEAAGISEKTIRRYLSRDLKKEFRIEKGVISRREDENSEPEEGGEA